MLELDYEYLYLLIAKIGSTFPTKTQMHVI
jgi:hypothetical protein